MKTSISRVICLGLLAGCGRPPAGPTTAGAGDTPAGSAEAAWAGVPRLEPVARFQLPGKHVRTYKRSVQLSADGTRVALGTDDPNGTKSFVQVWKLGPQPKLLFESPKESGGGTFALSPGGRRLLASGGVSPEAFDVDSGKSLGAFTKTARFSHAFFRDERVAVWTQRSHGFDQLRKAKVFVWDVVKNADAGSFETPDDRFEVAYPARDGAELWLVMSAGRFEVECYDVAARKLARVIKPELDDGGKPFTSAGIDPAVAADGSAFTADVTRQRFYDGTTGKAVGQLPAGASGLEDGFVPGGSRYLARRDRDQTKGGSVEPNDLVLLDWKTGRGLALLGGFSAAPADPLEGTEFDPRAGASADGKTAVIVSRSGEVLVFDVSGVK